MTIGTGPELPGEAELLDRVLAEDPRHRVARRAYERWLNPVELELLVAFGYLPHVAGKA